MASFVTSGLLNSYMMSSPSERRAKVRYACRLKGAWRPLGSQGIAWESLLQDVSETGLNLLMDCELKRGTILAVKLDCPHERFARPVLVRVARCAEQADGLWSVGCTFTSQLKDAELLALLQVGAMTTPAALPGPQPAQTSPKPVPPPPVAQPAPVRKPERQPRQEPPSSFDPFLNGAGSAEHRRTPRRGAASVAVLISRPRESEHVEGWVINHSLGGMCLSSPRTYEVDTILRVRPKRGGESPPAIEVRVRAVSAEGHQYKLHCQYTTQPSASTMMAFS
jgi:hypothetical protein